MSLHGSVFVHHGSFQSRQQRDCLISCLVAVGTFTFIQASVFPFKNKLINILDLLFSGIFLPLSSVVLCTSIQVLMVTKEQLAVRVFGYSSFAVFCVVILYHIYRATKGSSCYFKNFDTVNRLKDKYEKNKEDDFRWPFAVFSEEPDQRYGTIRTQDETEV